MIERLQRLQHPAVRTLLSLRRTRDTLTIRNTGPMNVALGPQINLTAPPADDPPPVIVRAHDST